MSRITLCTKTSILGIVSSACLVTAELRADCPFDTTSSQVQYGAASGQLGFPIGGPQECDTAPVSKVGSASLGGTFWQGTGFGELGIVRSSYTFTLGSGWWGWTPASNGSFYIPDIIISGAGETVDVRVNVTYSGTATNASDTAQGVAWSVRLRTSAGTDLAFATHSSPYTLNGPVAEASSNLLEGIPVGTPFSLELSAQWVPAGPPGGQTNIGSTQLALRTLEVFALPEGYTANSEPGGIVKNRLVSRIFLDSFEALVSE